MDTLGITHSLCGVCSRLLPAKLVTDGQDVFFRKFCPEHGPSESLVRRDLQSYLAALSYVKPAWQPRAGAAQTAGGCPLDCGLCPRHEQHLCLPIIEITSTCDLTCPACLVSAGRPWEISESEFRAILDGLIRAEGQIDVLNLSGGEPLLHPDLPALIDQALARPEIVRLSISTNGLALLGDRNLRRRLKERNVLVSLQFDGFEDGTYSLLRGRPLLAEKLRLLDLLGAEDLPMSLTFTAAGGVNDHEFPRLLELFFSRENIISLMIQPLAFTGRGRTLQGRVRPLTIPDITRLLGAAGHPAVQAGDFLPLPCSHPLCFSLAFYLLLEGADAVSLNRLVAADVFLDSLANRTVYGLEAGEYQRLKEMIYDLWSGPAASAPQSAAVLKTISGILRRISCASGSGFDPREVFRLAERRVKSIFIHAFQDAGNFDLARVRRCCNGYPQPDGRVVPACVHNLRGGRA